MHSWDKSDSETEKQYQAFTQYLLLGPDRSIEKVGQKWSKSGATSRLQIWSSENNWVARAAAYDQFLAKDSITAQMQANVSKEILDYRKRAANLAAIETETSTVLLQKLIPKLKTIDVEALTATEIAQLIRAAFAVGEHGLNSEATAIGAARLAEALLHGQETSQDIS
jgi:hypothetical protein